MGTAIRGQISLGVPSSLSSILSVPLIETIFNERPEVQVSLVEGMDGVLLHSLTTERVDMACLYEPQDPNEYLMKPLCEERIYLATAPDNWPGQIGRDGFAIEPLDAARLAKLPIASGRANNGSRRMIDRQLRKHGIRMNVISEIDSLAQTLEMAERASCYCFVPHKAVLPQLAAKTLALVPIVLPTIMQTTYLTRKISMPASPTISYVEEMVRTVLTEVAQRRRINLTVF